MPIFLHAAALTHPGQVRDLNEDRVFQLVVESSDADAQGLFIVSDGVGGELAGEVASHWAVETLKTALADLFVLKNPRETIRLPETIGYETGQRPAVQTGGTLLEHRLREAVQKANGVVYAYTQNKPQEAEGAGCTVTTAFVRGRLAVGANVGDSRTYLWRGGELTQLTQDHSLVAALVAAGQITPEEVFTNPQRNVITRSLGDKADVDVDTWRCLLEPGDMLLLCSDGLWEMLHDNRQIALLMNRPDPRQACQDLVSAANEYGGQDNIGVVVVRMQET